MGDSLLTYKPKMDDEDYEEVDMYPSMAVGQLQVEIESTMVEFDQSMNDQIIEQADYDLELYAKQCKRAIMENNVSFLNEEDESDSEKSKGKIGQFFENLSKWFMNLMRSIVDKISGVIAKLGEMFKNYKKLAEKLKDESFEGISGKSGVEMWSIEPTEIVKEVLYISNKVNKAASTTEEKSLAELSKVAVDDENVSEGFKKNVLGKKSEVDLDSGTAKSFVTSLFTADTISKRLSKISKILRQGGKEGVKTAKEGKRAADKNDEQAVADAKAKIANMKAASSINVTVTNLALTAVRNQYSAMASYVKKAKSASKGGDKKEDGGLNVDDIISWSES